MVSIVSPHKYDTLVAQAADTEGGTMEHDETEGKTAGTEPAETPEPASRKSSAKEQHYVPRFYLKRFADQNGKLSVLNVRRKATYADVPCVTQCRKTNFLESRKEVASFGKLSD
jgi:hypothetical protein